MDFYPLSNETDDDEEDEMDPNVFLDVCLTFLLTS